MATKSFEELNTGALTIKNNELPESNTHTLVGTQLVDMVAKEQEIDSQAAQLRSDLSVTTDKLTELDKVLLNFPYDGFIHSAGGEFVPHNSYKSTDYIDLCRGGNILRSIKFGTSLFANICVAIYDNDKNFIRSYSTDSQSVIFVEGFINIKEYRNARYFRMTKDSTFVTPPYAKFTEPLVTPKIGTNDILDSSVTLNKLEFTRHDEQTNFVTASWSDDKYINAQGQEKSANGFALTDKVFLDQNTKYYYGGECYGYYCFFDDNNNVIEGHDYPDPPKKPFSIPVGASYARFTIVDKTKKNDFWVGLTPLKPKGYTNCISKASLPSDIVYSSEEYMGDDICLFKKGLCIGDSFTQGAFNYKSKPDGSYVAASPMYSYPANLTRLTGIEITNKGIGGLTSAEWYDRMKDEDLSGHDFCIIQLGINDGLYNNGWTNESLTAFTNIVNKVKTENNRIKIFIATIVPAPTYDYKKEALDSVSQGIRDFVASLSDENVILIDMAVKAHMSDESAYTSGHPTAYGYNRLAKDYKCFISEYIHYHKEQFRFIQLIGTDYEIDPTVK